MKKQLLIIIICLFSFINEAFSQVENDFKINDKITCPFFTGDIKRLSVQPQAYISNPGKWGFIDKTGQVVCGFIFDGCRSFHNGLAAVCMDGKWGFFNKNKPSISCDYEEVKDFNEGLAAAKKNNKWGFIDENLKEVILFKYNKVSDFHEGLARVTYKASNAFPYFPKFGYIDKKGNEIIKPIYSEAGDFHEGLAWVKNEGGKFGCIDKTGKVIIPFVYLFVKNFHSGLAAVRKFPPFGYGYINTSGKEVIPFEYKDASDFHENIAIIINKDSKQIIIDKKNKIIFKFSELSNFSFCDGIVRAIVDGKICFIDRAGNEIFSDISKNILDFQNGFARAEGLGMMGWGFVDKKLNLIIDFKYEEVQDFSEGLAPFKDHNSWGFMDINGKEVISQQYFDCLKFSEGLAAVMLPPIEGSVKDYY